MKTLIVTEKRDAGAEIASVLGDVDFGTNLSQLKTKSKAGFLESSNYIITWASGHLYSEVMPSDINDSYKLYNLLETPEDYRLENLVNEIYKIPNTDKHKLSQIKIIKDILKRDDIAKVILAPDADAEGCAIARDLIFLTNPKFDKPMFRFWNTGSFKSKKAVDKAMANIEPYDSPKYENLYHSQIARSLCDYLVGLKTTKCAVDHYNKKFYMGRVKGSILSLLGNRENEINNFVPSKYWAVTALKDDLELSHFFYRELEKGEDKKTKEKYYFDIEEAEYIKSSVESDGLYVRVVKYETITSVSKSRPLPLSGSDFASQMMGLYKISYNECNEILDYLRQAGYTSYPGTNGRVFNPDDSVDVKEALNTANAYFNKSAEFTLDSYIFNKKKAEKQNHAPLHLTSKIPNESDLEKWANEKLPRIKEGYELIGKRILVAFLEDDEIEKQQLVVKSSGGHHFEITGQKALKQGWRTFLSTEIKDTTFKSNEPLKVDTNVRLDSVSLKQSLTKVPSLYTMKTLLDTLLNVSGVIDKLIKNADDPTLIKKYKVIKKLLKNAEGIGTDRTRQTIITSLLDNDVIHSNKKLQLILTVKGWELFKVYPVTLKSIVMTANWENAFEEIRRGERDYKDFIAEVDNHVMDEMIPDIINNVGVEVNPKIIKKDKIEGVDCPLCASTIYETEKAYKCENNSYSNGKQEGCKFSIIKNQIKTFGRVLDGKSDIQKILLNTSKDNLYKEKKHGIYFDKNSDYFIGVVWDEVVSKNELKETKKTYQKGDNYLFKEFRGRKITASQAEKILEGKTVTITRKSKAGKSYKVKVKLKSEGGLLDVEFA